MAAGVRATDHHREPVFTRVFMDDRTIVSSDPQFLVNQIQRWETWSESVGLLESKTKTQLTGATQLCRTRLASVATEPAKVQSSFGDVALKFPGVLNPLRKRRDLLQVTEHFS